MLSDNPVKSLHGEWSVRKSLGYIQRKRWLIDNDSHRFLQKCFTNAKNVDARSNIFWLHSGDAPFQSSCIRLFALWENNGHKYF